MTNFLVVILSTLGVIVISYLAGRASRRGVTVDPEKVKRRVDLENAADSVKAPESLQGLADAMNRRSRR